MSQENEKIVAKDKEHLKALITEAIKKNGNECDLNFIDVSNVTDMSFLFKGVRFDGDISQWDVSNVTNMEGMFIDCKFDGDISGWKVTNVTNFRNMFYCFDKSSYAENLQSWEIDISKADTRGMFATCDMPHNHVPTLLHVNANDDNIKALIERATAILGKEADLSFIDVSCVTNMKCLFKGSDFNGNLSSWKIDISKTSTEEMFEFCDIPSQQKPILLPVKASDDNIKVLVKRAIGILGSEANLSFIDVCNVTNMKQLFKDIEYTGNLNSWEIAIDKTSTEGMLEFCKIPYQHKPILLPVIANDGNIKLIVKRALEILGFEANLNFIDVSNVTNMAGLFEGSSFNGDISKWNVSKVTDMSNMFSDSKFRGSISHWDVSKVTDMSHMFYFNKFRLAESLQSWEIDISKTDTSGMFSTRNIPHNDVPTLLPVKANDDNINILVERAIEMLGFDANLNFIDVSNVTNMAGLFSDDIIHRKYSNRTLHVEKFRGDISNWDVSNVTDMSYMFEGSAFNGDISRWKVSNGMFLT